MSELTPRMAEAKQFIAEHTKQKGYAPSCQEIGNALHLRSKSGVHRLIEGLEQRGHLTRLPKRSRSISLTEPGVLAVRPDTVEELEKIALREGTTWQAIANEILAESMGMEDGGVTT